jgi:hypothetical protein
MHILTFPLIIVSAALAAVPPTCEGPPIGTGGAGGTGGASCGAATGCAAGQACCAGQCANIQDDRENCGRCGIVCADGAVCSAGRCVPDPGAACNGSAGCGAGQACCAGLCKSLLDPNNCGRCGLVCAVGAVCTAQGCVLP